MFDAQVFQTPAWHRGMGKYSFELIRAVANLNLDSQKWDSIDIIISSLGTIDKALEDDLNALPNVRIHKLHLAPNDILNPSETSIHNRRIINDFTVNVKDDISFIILSLMQGEISPVFPTDKKVHKSVLFYDLIPLMFHKTYLQNPITRKEYLSKLEELLSADSFLAISKTVANDLSVYLGINPSCIVSIDGGPIAHDTKTEPMDVPQHFILMPTGNDLRKNNRKGIEGFNLFNKRHKDKYTLVITSYFEEWQIEELSKLSENIIFTGNISGANLNYLYKHTEVLLFPSLYEGLGLPVLEALENNVNVACSDITVFREISQTAFSYFDPNKIHSIADGLERALTKSLSKESSKAILRKYSWENTAKITEKSIDLKPSRSKKSTKISIVASNISNDNLVGKLILQSHASFSRRFNVAYCESSTSSSAAAEHRINFLPYITKVHQLNLNAPIIVNDDGRIPIYHMVNQKESDLIALSALANPGIIILHDLDLRIVWDELKNKNLISNERYNLESQINETFGTKQSSWVGSLIAHQLAVIVFSRKAEELLNKILEKMNVSTKVVYFDLPANNLVYVDIIATKKEKSLALDNLANLDDMEYEVTLSDTGHLEIPAGATSTKDLLPGVEANKYIANNPAGYNEYANKFADLIVQIRGADL